jgi:hypothetical protein
MQKHGLHSATAAANFWVLDAHGLITQARPGMNQLVSHFARRDAESQEGESLVSVIKRVRALDEDRMTFAEGFAGQPFFKRLATCLLIDFSLYECPCCSGSGTSTGTAPRSF